MFKYIAYQTGMRAFLVVVAGVIVVFGLVFAVVAIGRAPEVIFTDDPFEVVDDVVIREIEGRGARCFVTIRDGGLAGRMAWLDACVRGMDYEGPLRWREIYE